MTDNFNFNRPGPLAINQVTDPILRSSFLFHQTSVTLDDDAIKALPVYPFVPVDLLPAAGPDRIALPTCAVYRADARAGAYTNTDANTRLYMAYAGSGVPLAALEGSLLTAAAVRVGFAGIDGYPDASTVVTGLTGSRNYQGGVDNALQLFGDNAGGAFTGGAAANTLIIAIVFLVFDGALGQFLTVAESGWNPITRTFAA